MWWVISLSARVSSYYKIWSVIKMLVWETRSFLKGKKIKWKPLNRSDRYTDAYLSTLMYTRSLWFSQRENHIHMKKLRQRFVLACNCMCLSRTDKRMLALFFFKLMEFECTLYLWESFINFFLNSCTWRDNGWLQELLCCSVLHRM